MRDRTPEFYQIDKIVDEAVSRGLLSGDDEGVDTDTRFIRNLAAPLEAANARIREMEAELTRLREIEADARAANLIGLDGKVRRVLGTLPVTRDGVIVPLFENLWFIDRFATKNCDGKYGSAVARAVPTSSTLSDGILEFRASFGVDACRVSDCYSTPEAAQAAKEGKP